MSRLEETRALASGAVVALVLIFAAPALTLAATPDATRPVGNDPRSSGEGPGLVGDPVFAIGLVLAIGVAALVLTLVYVRMTGRPKTTE
jgi:hypothetical protein